MKLITAIKLILLKHKHTNATHACMGQTTQWLCKIKANFCLAGENFAIFKYIMI